MRPSGHAVHTEEMRNACRIVVGKTGGNRRSEDLKVECRMLLKWIHLTWLMIVTVTGPCERRDESSPFIKRGEFRD